MIAHNIRLGVGILQLAGMSLSHFLLRWKLSPRRLGMLFCQKTDLLVTDDNSLPSGGTVNSIKVHCLKLIAVGLRALSFHLHSKVSDYYGAKN